MFNDYLNINKISCILFFPRENKFIKKIKHGIVFYIRFKKYINIQYIYEQFYHSICSLRLVDTVERSVLE